MIRVAFLVNGDHDSALGHRARAFALRLQGRCEIQILYRSRSKMLSLIRFLVALVRLRPEVCYVFDMSYSGVLAGAWYKALSRSHLIVDTGDAITELARALDRGRLGMWLTRHLEKYSLRVADCVVVRGTYHQEWLSQQGVQSIVIPDGVDTCTFFPFPVDDLRAHYGLDGLLTVGLVGSSVWSERLQMCYGWDLVEAMRLLKNYPVKAILIGTGSGIPRLQTRCREYGIEDKVLFLGPVPLEELPQYLNLIDVCLSTQTNDLVGRVRTTGKLPLYLATGRYVLASRVGEAALVLDESMLVEYQGVKDAQYPHRLAERILGLLQHPEALQDGAKNVARARQRFDYAVLTDKLIDVIDTTVGRPCQKTLRGTALGKGECPSTCPPEEL